MAQKEEQSPYPENSGLVEGPTFFHPHILARMPEQSRKINYKKRACLALCLRPPAVKATLKMRGN